MPSSSRKNNRKRKLPHNFLDAPSLSLVADFPSAEGNTNMEPVVSTHAASEATKEIFLERFTKEVVKQFRQVTPRKGGGRSFVMVNGTLQRQSPVKSDKGTVSIKGIWNRRIRMGTNQCLRILEQCMSSDCTVPNKPLLIVLARDVYPPTMLAEVPVIARKIGIPLLLLPGKASNEIGESIGVKKTSILLFLANDQSDNDPDHARFDSFLDFVTSDVIPKK